jgi:hypothetical protein
VLSHPNIVLADQHQSGVVDSATPLRNIQQAASGKDSRRSRYPVPGAPAPPGPGGTTPLQPETLRLLLKLADRHLLRVTEICGGATGELSTHPDGWSFDLDMIDGEPIAPGERWQRLRREARHHGATACFGPGRFGHDSIVHVEAMPKDDPRFPWPKDD